LNSTLKRLEFYAQTPRILRSNSDKL